MILGGPQRVVGLTGKAHLHPMADRARGEEIFCTVICSPRSLQAWWAFGLSGPHRVVGPTRDPTSIQRLIALVVSKHGEKKNLENYREKRLCFPLIVGYLMQLFSFILSWER